MTKPNVDLLRRRTITDPDQSPSGVGELGSDPEAQDFTFAFNDINFSDRILRIEIVPDSPEAKPDGVGCSTASDWERNKKRRRADIKRDSAEDILAHSEEQVLNCNIPDTVDDVAFENQDEEAAAMNESPSGVGRVDEAVHSNDSSWSMDCATVLKVNTIHVSSPILAAKSPFFYKLFSNGMRESEQRQVTLRIHASEEAALMDLINFMYSNTLSTITPPALLDVFKVADKFEVASCMRYCSRELRKFPMTRESALLYLDLPSSVLMADAVQPLTDAAKQFLAGCYKEISKFQDEVLNLPLAGIEAVLSSDDLQVASEDGIYDFVLRWARSHYPKLEERREVLGSRLGRLIRFPHMSCRKLRKVLTCNDFDPALASKIVLESLFFKAEAPFRQRSLALGDRRFGERSYKYRPIKLLEFEQPRDQCIVFLDLKREECARLFPAGRVYSQAFHLGGQGFFLSAHCNMDQQSSFHCFGLFLGMQEKGSVSFTVDYEFSARSKPGEDYLSKYKGNYTFTGGKAVGYRNLFGIPWTSFMADDSIYFIDSVLHLKAELTIRQ
ncbi:BTB/POZ domain-containing protein POB1-like isoform X2 [Prunus avium]|uniref:BTB/POZ domain-containing protein POB1-like isoform X1 n=1 Tax=Prunus avium TaxID=42229 RepID=A0A6P5T1B2_PRUAV|nr:BTB/POZ domain-containing protein POB1-like isoform X1 [Prunus avium]XP_021820517.1 BTB/POZ domain-containing protein POB1-like isoform X2 [Prunus avium]